MRFYGSSRPDVGDITMCTVTQYITDSGFNVRLEEYDLDGFLVLAELHNKKIKVPFSSFLKVGTQLPLAVISDEGSQLYLSKKDVKPEQATECNTRFILNNKLFQLCRVLPDPGSDQNWADLFRSVNTAGCSEDEHPMTLIQNRDFEQLQRSGLLFPCIELISESHAKLFGIKPKSVKLEPSLYSFSIDGNSHVTAVLIGIRDRYGDSWTDKELYDDNSKCNVSIMPIGLPKFHIKISAYLDDKCKEVMEEVKGLLQSSGLDIVQL
jgi:translation initiation factor 2 alpha subunit (eIF-2alpha)